MRGIALSKLGCTLLSSDSV